MPSDARILFLNGSSGSGKTTIAKRLNRDHQVTWFHPDGAWNTPEMDQRELTFKCVELVSKKYDCMVVVDSQLRNQFLVDSLEKYRVTLGKQILLDCSDSERESRLLARGLSNDEIAQMIHWARYLREESVQEKVSIVDTTSVSESDVVVSVLESIVEMGGI